MACALAMRPSAKTSSIEVNFKFSEVLDKTCHKLVSDQCNNRHNVYDKANFDIYVLIQDLERWTKVWPLTPQQVACMIESHLKGAPARYFQKCLETKSVSEASIALIKLFGKLPRPQDLMDEFCNHKINNKSMEQDLRDLLIKGIQAYPDWTIDAIEEHVALVAELKLSKEHGNAFRQALMKYQEEQAKTKLSCHEIFELMCDTNVQNSSSATATQHPGSASPNSWNRQSSPQDIAPIPADTIIAQDGSFKGHTNLHGHESMVCDKTTQEWVTEACSQPTCTTRSRDWSSTADPLCQQTQLMDVDRHEPMSTFQPEMHHSTNSQDERQWAHAGTNLATEMGLQLESHPAFQKNSRNNMEMFLQNLRKDTNFKLKEVTTPRNRDLPYRFHKENIILKSKPFRGVLMYKNTAKAKPLFSNEFLEHLQEKCYRCGEGCCAGSDDRCIYSNHMDTFKWCTTCNSGFHLEEHCKTIVPEELADFSQSRRLNNDLNKNTNMHLRQWNEHNTKVFENDEYMSTLPTPLQNILRQHQMDLERNEENAKAGNSPLADEQEIGNNLSNRQVNHTPVHETESYLEKGPFRQRNETTYDTITREIGNRNESSDDDNESSCSTVSDHHELRKDLERLAFVEAICKEQGYGTDSDSD
jgi:hypothetical protein